MAQTDYKPSGLFGFDLYTVDTVPTQPIGTKIKVVSPTHGEGEAIYLKGATSTAEGGAVTYDEAGVTTALAANAIGPVAWALAATIANTYGWYMIGGKIAALCAASSADNAKVGYEGAAFTIGDGRAAGDEIYGVISRSATDTPATGFCWIQAYGCPFVDDANGA